MLLSHEHVSKAERFSESGYTGELLPARRGALAVVGLSSDSAHLTEVTAELAHAIHFGS
jgi:hypothetical protein